MGFKKFIAVKSVSYFTVLIATVSILYLATFKIIQQVITSSAAAQAQEYKRSLLQSGATRGMSAEQLQNAINSYTRGYLSQFGFNQSPVLRYFVQLANLLSFKFGDAYNITWNGSKNVGVIISGYLPNTILLFTTATLILIALGTIIGLLAAKSAGSVWDRIVPLVAVVHSSLPAWWLGLLLVAALAYYYPIFPAVGMVTPALVHPHNVAGDFLYFGSILSHMTLPLLSLLIVGVGGFAYIIRSLVISTMGEDFVLTARARGIPESRVLFRHIFRTASPAIATQSILAVAGSFAGALTTEIVFSWPGVGLLTYTAIFSNDLPVIVGIVFVLTIVLLIGLFMGELVYGVLDPRIRYSND
jgi:peptide/nickel transport system permease protein